MNSDSPIPIGAIKVPLCFSAASMKIVKTSCAVRNISMKRPRTTEVPADRFVRTRSGPGKRAETTAAAAMPPRICDITTNTPRTQGTAPMRHMPNDTCQSFSLWRGCCVQRTGGTTYRGIEQASTNPKENPGVHCEREAKGQGYIKQLGCVGNLSR